MGIHVFFYYFTKYFLGAIKIHGVLIKLILSHMGGPHGLLSPRYKRTKVRVIAGVGLSSKIAWGALSLCSYSVL